MAEQTSARRPRYAETILVGDPILADAYLEGWRGVREGIRCRWFGTVWLNSHRVSDKTLGLGALD